ncbi:MAG: hypothetical protein WA990_01810 [Rubrobacteraceae bacterium]
MSEEFAGTPAGSGHWFEEHALFVRYLIVRHTHHGMEVLVTYAEGEATLPVFSSKRMAREYLQSGEFRSPWHVRESTAGELISLLMGHVADVEFVILDPLSGPSAGGEALPETLSKESFISSLMQEPMLMSPR